MLDGFNEGWIDLPTNEDNRLTGNTSAALVPVGLSSKSLGG
jgi:hypothetical protein